MRNVLIYFSIKYEGDYLKILEAIKNKEIINNEDIVYLKQKNISAITYVDEVYPARLKEIYAPPLVLFYKGDISLLNDKNSLAVIGSRNPSEYGIKATKKVLNELFELKMTTIVSGLAKGIDAIAHQEAIINNQNTIAVLGCGIDICYPKENIVLYKDIEENGLIISEYPEGVEPNKKYFPLRNRIIAGLSKGVLVTDATSPSGTQNTVRYALEMNRDVFAIPHEILKESFCNTLIKQGASPILTGNDIVEELF